MYMWEQLNSLNRISNFLTFLIRLNSSFGTLKKKTRKLSPKFCTCDGFGPQDQFWLGLRWRGTLNEVPRVIFIYFFGPEGPKTATVAKLRGRFAVFFLRRPKPQLRES